MAGSPQDAPLMLRPAQAEARRPHPLLRQRDYQGRDSESIEANGTRTNGIVINQLNMCTRPYGRTHSPGKTPHNCQVCFVRKQNGAPEQGFTPFLRCCLLTPCPLGRQGYVILLGVRLHKGNIVHHGRQDVVS